MSKKSITLFRRRLAWAATVAVLSVGSSGSPVVAGSAPSGFPATSTPKVQVAWGGVSPGVNPHSTRKAKAMLRTEAPGFVFP